MVDTSPYSLERNPIKMDHLGKEYKYERHEKFDEFLSALGIPKERVDTILSHASSQTLEKDGDTYTLTLNGHDGVKKLKFKPGVEIDEKVENLDSKTMFLVNGNTLVQTQRYPDSHYITYKKEFSDDKVVVTATTCLWKGVAYRYYYA